MRSCLLIGMSLATLLVSACAPKSPPPSPHRNHYLYNRPQDREHCQQECTDWRVERRCFRRCRLRGPLGRCVAWERVCRRHKVCPQRTTRCK